MPDSSSSAAGDAESSSGLLGSLGSALKKMVGADEANRSLRKTLEEKIDEHEGENGDHPNRRDGDGNDDGDLSPVERQMLRNLIANSAQAQPDEYECRFTPAAAPTSSKVPSPLLM